MLRGSQAQGSEERNDCFAAVFPLIRRGFLARAAAKVKRYFEYLNALWVVILNAKGNEFPRTGITNLPHLFFYTTNHDKPQ